MDESILKNIKRLLNVEEDDDAFDMEILIHLDSVFSELYSRGVGPANAAFSLLSAQDPAAVKWSDFLGTKTNINLARSYIYLKVRLLFDPPATSFAIQAMKDQAEEQGFRLATEDDKSGREGLNV